MTTTMRQKADLVAEMSKELLQKRWLVTVYYGVHGASVGDLMTTFDRACVELNSYLKSQQPARVWEMDFAAGTLRDVTEDVEAALAAKRGGAR